MTLDPLFFRDALVVEEFRHRSTMIALQLDNIAELFVLFLDFTVAIEGLFQGFQQRFQIERRRNARDRREGFFTCETYRDDGNSWISATVNRVERSPQKSLKTY